MCEISAVIFCKMSKARKKDSRSQVQIRSDFAYGNIAKIKRASEMALSANECARSVPTRRINSMSARDARTAARSKVVYYTTPSKKAKAEQTILRCVKEIIYARDDLLVDEGISWSEENHCFQNGVFTSLLLGIKRRSVTGDWDQIRRLDLLAVLSTIYPTDFWSDDDLGTTVMDRFWSLPAKHHCLIDRDTSSF
jgi:hypothetical protein